MEKVRRRRVSMIRLFAELIEESIILVFLELKLAVFEIKRNVKSAEKGAVMMVLGGGLLLFGSVTFVATAVAALAIVLPVWLSALIIALGLSFLGFAFLFSGLGHLKDFTLVPLETLERVDDLSQKIKQVSARHQEAEERKERAFEDRRKRVFERQVPERRERALEDRRKQAFGRHVPERRRLSARRHAA